MDDPKSKYNTLSLVDGIRFNLKLEVSDMVLYFAHGAVEGITGSLSECFFSEHAPRMPGKA